VEIHAERLMGFNYIFFWRIVQVFFKLFSGFFEGNKKDNKKSSLKNHF